MSRHHNGCAIFDDGQCTCDALPYPRDRARSVAATPSYLQIDWLERRVKELEEENVRQTEYGIKQHEIAQDAINTRDSLQEKYDSACAELVTVRRAYMETITGLEETIHELRNNLKK